MDRRTAAKSLAVGLAAASLRLPESLAADGPQFEVVDLNVGLAYQLTYRGRPLRRGSGAYRAEDLAAAGVVGVVLQLQFPPHRFPVGPTLDELARAHADLVSALRAAPEYAMPGCAKSPSHVRTWLSLQAATPFAKAPDAIADWVRRGLRIFALVHRYDNSIASSSGKRPQSKWGLTRRGRDVVRRVWAAGALVDVSHCSDAATEEVLALARKAGAPVLATHSDARALSSHRRNLTDAQLRGIAKTGGLVGLNFHRPFLAAGRRAKLSHAVRHVRHMIEQMGVEHVALGSDLESETRPPRELSDVTAFPRLARALLADGLAPEDVRRIYSTNALRILCPGSNGSA